MKHYFTCEHCQKQTSRIRAKGCAAPRFCSLECRRVYQKSNFASPATKEWFYQKYIVEQLDCVQIGKLLNKDPKTVWYWLRKFDIPTRKRGTTDNLRHVKKHGRLGKTHTPEVRERLRQARLRDGHVPYLKDGKHHLKGKRGADTPNWKGGVSPQRQSVYGSPEWKEAVKIVWRRDNATCQRCGLHRSKARQTATDFDIHHIVSFAVEELRCDPSNLVLLCEPCHYWVHSSANADKEFLK